LPNADEDDVYLPKPPTLLTSDASCTLVTKAMGALTISGDVVVGNQLFILEAAIAAVRLETVMRNLHTTMCLHD
jgi:hypothetical protein